MHLPTRWQPAASLPWASAPLHLACAGKHCENAAQRLLAQRHAVGAAPRGGGGEAMPGGTLHGRGSALWRPEASERCWVRRQSEKRAQVLRGDGDGAGEEFCAQG